MTEGGAITAAERAKPLPQIASSDLVSGHISDSPCISQVTRLLTFMS